MDEISSDAYRALLADATVLEQDSHGAKVLLTAAGEIVKIFRQRRRLSGASVYPYARRFARNGQRLHRLGIATVRVSRLARCRQPRRHLIWYTPLPGQTLRDFCAEHDVAAIAADLGRFVAMLHDNGVLFRSLHWGNIIISASGELGLIDIADIRFYPWALSFGARRRNFRHMLRYGEDRHHFAAAAAGFWPAYTAATAMVDDKCARLQQVVSP